MDTSDWGKKAMVQICSTSFQTCPFSADVLRQKANYWCLGLNGKLLVVHDAAMNLNAFILIVAIAF